MVAAGLPLRCVALEATGEYDTHAGQAAELTPALTTTASSLFAFQRDLEARGVADRVLTLVWSEFGRRAEENGSGGTDHGAAGTGFLIGTRAAGQADRRVPGARERARRRREPEGDLRLPLGLCLAARAVAPVRRCARHPESQPLQSRPARQMKLVLLVAVLVALAFSALAFGGIAPARMQVVAREFSFGLSRTHVKAGHAVIELANFGSDPHDLRLQRIGAQHIAGLGEVAARRARRAQPQARAGAILALVLDRESSRARHAGDARRLALSVDDVGDPHGTPVVYLHGGGDSRLSRHPDDEIAEPSSACVCWLSTAAGRRVHLRSLREWAERVADALEVERFGVIGWSAGGPHALALAAVAPERVSRVALVASMPPPDGVARAACGTCGV